MTFSESIDISSRLSDVELRLEAHQHRRLTAQQLRVETHRVVVVLSQQPTLESPQQRSVQLVGHLHLVGVFPLPVLVLEHCLEVIDFALRNGVGKLRKRQVTSRPNRMLSL